jgi:glutamate synthase domain-containing protein 2
MRFSTPLRLAILAVAVSGLSFAEEVNGILMTTMCAAGASKGGQDAAMKHERTCNLKPNCAKTGFGVVTSDNKFIGFDDAGNDIARKALEASTKKDDMKVVVTGEMDGGKLKVASLKLLD